LDRQKGSERINSWEPPVAPFFPPICIPAGKLGMRIALNSYPGGFPALALEASVLGRGCKTLKQLGFGYQTSR